MNVFVRLFLTLASCLTDAPFNLWLLSLSFYVFLIVSNAFWDVSHLHIRIEKVFECMHTSHSQAAYISICIECIGRNGLVNWENLECACVRGMSSTTDTTVYLRVDDIFNLCRFNSMHCTTNCIAVKIVIIPENINKSLNRIKLMNVQK